MSKLNERQQQFLEHPYVGTVTTLRAGRLPPFDRRLG